MTSFPSDLLEAPTSGVSKPTRAGTDYSSSSPEFPMVYGDVVSSAESMVVDPHARESLLSSSDDPHGALVTGGAVAYPGADSQSDVENTDPVITDQPETNDLLALSMMVAGQGASGGQNDAEQPLTPANRLQSLAGFETMTGMSQAPMMEAKGADDLLIVAPEPVRLSQSESSIEHRPPISAGFSSDASLANSSTKPFANVDQSLDLNQTGKQQQASEMATFVRVLKNKGGGEAKINLHPAELGRMSISVSTDAADTKVSFVVETAQARQVIEAAMPKLKELLEQSGLSLSDSDVTEHHQQAENEKTDDQGRSCQSADLSESQSEGGELTLSVALDTNRLLDAYA